MRFIALVLAVAVVGAGVGLVSVGTAQAHSGLGGVPDEVIVEGNVAGGNCVPSITVVDLDSTCHSPGGGERQ